MDGAIDAPRVRGRHRARGRGLGSEGEGLARLVGETCDRLVSIPMRPRPESLNAGVAACVTLYEISRRRAS